MIFNRSEARKSEIESWTTHWNYNYTYDTLVDWNIWQAKENIYTFYILLLLYEQCRLSNQWSSQSTAIDIHAYNYQPEKFGNTFKITVMAYYPKLN